MTSQPVVQRRRYVYLVDPVQSLTTNQLPIPDIDNFGPGTFKMQVRLCLGSLSGNSLVIELDDMPASRFKESSRNGWIYANISQYQCLLRLAETMPKEIRSQ